VNKPLLGAPAVAGTVDRAADVLMRAVGTCGTGRQLARLANSSRRARDNILTLERRRRLWQVRACVCVSACVVLKPALRGGGARRSTSS